MKSFEIYISQRLDLIYFFDFLSRKIFLFCNFNKVSIYLTVLTCRWLSVHLKTLHQWSQTWSGWAWMTCFVLLNLLLLIKHLNLSDWLESLLKAKNMLRMSTFCCLQFETSAAISDIAGFFFHVLGSVFLPKKPLELLHWYVIPLSELRFLWLESYVHNSLLREMTGLFCFGKRVS